MMWRPAGNRKDNPAVSELHPLYPLACANVIITVLWGSQRLCVHSVHGVHHAAPLKDMLGRVIFFPISEKGVSQFSSKVSCLFPLYTVCECLCVLARMLMSHSPRVWTRSVEVKGQKAVLPSTT